MRGAAERQQISIQERLRQELEDIGGDPLKDSGFEGEKPAAKTGTISTENALEGLKSGNMAETLPRGLSAASTALAERSFLESWVTLMSNAGVILGVK